MHITVRQRPDGFQVALVNDSSALLIDLAPDFEEATKRAEYEADARDCKWLPVGCFERRRQHI